MKFVQPIVVLGLVACLSVACDSSKVPAEATAPEKSDATEVQKPVEPASADGDTSAIGARVFVVERASESFAIYDYMERKLLDKKISGLGDMRHATMTFSPDLKWGYVATRNGKLSRINLQSLEREGDVFTSKNSIDIAISQDGRFIATAEYEPGGVTILNARTLEVEKRIPAFYDDNGEKKRSQVTGIVDAPGNRFVCSMMEGKEIWVIDASDPEFPIEHRIKPADEGLPYDAMITPNGRYYVVGHLGTSAISVIDLTHPEKGARKISLRDPKSKHAKSAPTKLPHMASWAVAGRHIFVPLVGEPRLAVLNRYTFEFERSIEIAGPPVYSVSSPNEQKIWVSFSGEEFDAKVQVIDTETLEVDELIHVGGRIYHMDFTPRGAYVLITANRDDKLVLVDATTYKIIDEETVKSPSGVFGVWRAFKIGL